MPTYEYECSKCGHRFEKFQSMTAVPLKQCPQCRGKVRRLLGSGAGIIFKGSGFYQTDYRSDSYKQAAKSDSPSSDSAGKADKKTAPAEKPASKESAKSSKKE